MRECTENDLPKVLAILEKDIQNAVYMYIDLAKYGLNHPQIQAWLEEDEHGISAILMRYHDSMQIYSFPGATLHNFAQAIQKTETPRIYGPVHTLEPIQAILQNKYEYSKGWVAEIETFRHVASPIPIEYARDDELEECAALICTDPELGKNIDPCLLAKQLRERRNDGMGRNFVMRKGGKIIGHNSTFAEFRNIAVGSGLIIHPNYRNNIIYGLALESYGVNELLREHFRIFEFSRSEERIKFLSALGNNKFYSCARMMKIT